MGGIPGREELEGAGLERQPLRRPLRREDIVEPPFPRGRGDGGQHLGREVISGHHPGMACHPIGDMAAARAEVERMGRRAFAHDRLERLQIRALRMHRALHISPGLRSELGHDRSFMRCAHRLLRSGGRVRSRQRSWTRTDGSLGPAVNRYKREGRPAAPAEEVFEFLVLSREALDFSRH